MNQYIPLWESPRTILSDNGLQFCSKLSQYQMLGVDKLATSSHHPNCDGGVERVNHTMAQMLAMVVNERQDDWDLHLLHVKFTYNKSVSAATGLAPNEVHMGRLPRLFLMVFDRTGVVGRQPIANWPPTGKSARTTLSAHTTPSPFLALIAEIPPSPTRCVQHLSSLWVVGHGCTILPPQSARV